MLANILLAVATQFLASPHREPLDPLPYAHPDRTCYGIYQRMTDDVELRRRVGHYARASEIAESSALQIGRCLRESATETERRKYRYSYGRALWIAGEYAYAAGNRHAACSLVARGRRELVLRFAGESRPAIREIVGEWIRQSRRDLRGNWWPWEVPGGYRRPIHPDAPCPENIPNNPTDTRT